MKQMHLPLIPAEAGIQTESTDTSLSLLGRRFRVDERMGAVGSISVKLALGAALRGG